jgi:hypothetical protein
MHAASRVARVSAAPLRRASYELLSALTLAPAEAMAVAIDSETVDSGTISPPCCAVSGAQRSRVAAFSARHNLRQHAAALEIKHRSRILTEAFAIRGFSLSFPFLLGQPASGLVVVGPRGKYSMMPVFFYLLEEVNRWDSTFG